MPLDYEVTLCSKGISEFKGKGVTYYVAIDSKSTYNKRIEIMNEPVQGNFGHTARYARSRARGGYHSRRPISTVLQIIDVVSQRGGFQGTRDLLVLVC